MKNKCMKQKFTLVLGFVAAGMAAVLIVGSLYGRAAPATAVIAQNPQHEDAVYALQAQINDLQALLNALIQALDTHAAAVIPSISGQMARDLAVDFAGGGVARDILLFSENNILTFEVTVWLDNVRHMVYINAISGNVNRMIRFEDGAAPMASVPAPPAPPVPTPVTPAPSVANDRNNRPTSPAISLARAIEIAEADLQRRGIAAIFHSDSGMDWERGQWVWEIEFRVGGNRRHTIEYHISVTTGDVVKFEWDD